MRKLIHTLVLLSLFASCDQGDDNPKLSVSEDVNTSTQGNKELPGLSIYHLPSTWTTQDNKELQLKELHGNVLVMVMIYTTCKTACPRLIADMRNIESQIPTEDLDEMKFVIVSIDPVTDTPQRLKKFSEVNNMEEDHWVFLRGTPEDTREFANVLAMSYKRISPMDFAHSNIISVFDEEGVLVHQKEGLGMDYGETITAINAEIKD